MARCADTGGPEWVESGGGPLIAVPEAVLAFWAGADSEELDTDYDRACEVGGRVGLLPVGDSAALVFGDEPDATSFLPDHGTFVRRPAHDAAPLTGVGAALDSAVWGSEVRWRVPGPVLLFDAARPGRDAGRAAHLRVPLRAGTYAVRAASVRPEPGTSLGLVRLSPLAP